MASTIQEYVEERGIDYLLHYTRLSNLDSILKYGLVTRDKLQSSGFSDFNDAIRLDETHSICATINFPNYKLFYPTRMSNPQVGWVVLGIHKSALWELPCAFCTTNAANNTVTTIPLAQRTSLSAFKAMYGEIPEKPRSLLRLSNNLTTDPQAEVLFLDGIPRKYIFAIGVENDSMEKIVTEKYPDIQVKAMPKFYYGRHDYLYWQ